MEMLHHRVLLLKLLEKRACTFLVNLLVLFSWSYFLFCFVYFTQLFIPRLIINMDYYIGPALIFEGEEAMIAAITEDPSRFKVFPYFIVLSRDSRLMCE